MNRYRANFRQMESVEVKSAAADDLSLVLSHHKIANILAKLRNVSWQKCAITIIRFHDGVDRFHVRQDGITRTYHVPPAMLPRLYVVLSRREHRDIREPPVASDGHKCRDQKPD